MTTPSKGQKTRALVVRKVKTLLNLKGFNHTSINDVIRATGVKKGNLYFHFSGKEHLALAALQEAKKDFLEFLTRELQGKSPLQRLSRFFDAVLEYHRQRNLVGGCIFGNMALETSDSNPRLAREIEDVFQLWIGAMAHVLNQARQAGELKTDLPVEFLARHVVAAIEGGIMLARLSKNPEHLRQCLHSLRGLLGMKAFP